MYKPKYKLSCQWPDSALHSGVYTMIGGKLTPEKFFARAQYGQSSWKGSKSSGAIARAAFMTPIALACITRLGALSFFPSGRPGGPEFRAGRQGSRCLVSACQVRPVQMSRTVFSLTLYFWATRWLLFLDLESKAGGLSMKISTAWSWVRMARGLAAMSEFLL